MILITFFPYHHLTIILYLRWIVPLEKLDQNALTLFHCNIRSLPKNLSLVRDILYCLYSRPNIIAISETRLNENSVWNIELSNYYFFHHDSPTAAGGAGLYVSKNWKSIPRPDLQLDVELVKSCWVEVGPCNGKAHVVIGCVYRHPSVNIDDFTRKLDELIKNLNWKKPKVYILGDINIVFLKCNGHSPNEDHLEMLYSNNFLPIITKPTSLNIWQL